MNCLEKANDLDQHLKYVEGSKVQGIKLKSALDDLVILSDTIPTIDELIKERRIDDTNDMLSASLRLAQKINDLLSDVKRGMKSMPSSQALIQEKRSRKNESVVDVEVVE